jgi:hypothetical protein
MDDSSISIDLSSIQNATSNLSVGNITINSSSVTSGVYTTNNTGAYPWINTVHDTSIYGQKSLSVRGDAEIEGKLKIAGKDIGESLAKIEERLAILQINPELESRWEQLRELGEQYRKLEQDLLSKEEIYNILKR